MSSYVGRHRGPSTPLTSSLPVRGAATVGAVAAVGLAVPTAAQAAPSTTSTPASGATSSTSQAKLFDATVRWGDRGWIVIGIQKRLGIKADGVYGSKTYWAVRAYQRKQGLKVDGMVGKWTGRRLGLPGTYKTSYRTKKAASRSTSRSSTSTGSKIVNTAKKYYGVPYRYGGTTPSGFDCSGFTGYVYKKNGESLPRTAEQQRRGAWKTSNPKAGDLVFFGKPAYHVGIYAGKGQIIDAGSSGSKVRKRSIWTSAVTYGRY